MFNFRLIDTPDGNQVIDRNLKTSYNSLTPAQIVEYREIDVQLSIMDSVKRKTQREAQRNRKFARNPLWKIACLCGIV